jgi:hypothetical protein
LKAARETARVAFSRRVGLRGRKGKGGDGKGREGDEGATRILLVDFFSEKDPWINPRRVGRG